jgi:hypothetical protein
MKKVLLSCTLLLAVATLSKVNAQCTPYNFKTTIKNIAVDDITDIATATLDVSFNIHANNGNKYIFIHLWTGANYNQVNINWSASSQKAPTKDELNGVGNTHPTLYNLVIDNNVTPQSYKTEYTDKTLALNVPAGAPAVSHLPNGADSFTVRDIVVNFDANLLQSLGSIIQGVVWSSNANAYSKSMSVQCYLAGAVFLADPLISGFGSCGTSTYNVTVTHNSLLENNTLTGSLDVYVDADGDGQFSSDHDVKITASAIPFSVTASTPVTSYYTGAQTFSGSIPALYKSSNLFVVLTSGSTTLTQFLSTTQCSTLPVSFRSFTVARNNQMVAIKWETAFEQNNRGFYVQRNVNGEWKDIAFVFSKADDGNSTEPLSYVYNDPNTYNTVSYYRVLQVDLSGLGKYSEIRVIRGEELASKLMLFPNPGTNGKVNVIFTDENSQKNVIVYDATGRAIKTFKNLTGSNLTIEQLKPGVYNIQVISAASKTVSSAKFIIKD